MLKTLTILGAGYMGSAISCPLSENTEKINLWGTWLDDELIDASEKGRHPKIGKKLPENVRLFRSEQLAESLENTELVIVAVSSEGFSSVFGKLLEIIKKDTPILSITKGFIEDNGNVLQISLYAEKLYRQRFPEGIFRWGSIGGPVKAVELADKIPTHSIYGLRQEFPGGLLEGFPTSYYRVSLTDDVSGVEICSALKNAYAIALGICDGAYGGNDYFYDNIKAYFLSQAVIETAAIVKAAGGRTDTSYYLAGTGDLYVTAQSGRNKVYGTYIGKGVDPDEAVKTMLDAGDIAEGYHSIKYGKSFIEGLALNVKDDFPLFNMLYSILFQGKAADKAIRDFINSTGRLYSV